MFGVTYYFYAICMNLDKNRHPFVWMKNIYITIRAPLSCDGLQSDLNLRCYKPSSDIYILFNALYNICRIP